jgi:hypothetical protein
VDLYLYSTNSLAMLQVCREYRNDVHRVWCSEYFDPDLEHRHSLSAAIPKSSSPKAIYDRGKQATVGEPDRHDPIIQRWRTRLAELAVEWHENGDITEADKAEVVYLAEHAEAMRFRPVLYVIRRDLITPERLIRVQPQEKAGLGGEYQIHDLRGSEFEVLEY